jgi:hypothetical protein
MSITDHIDRAGQRAPLPKMQKTASADIDVALKLADMMDKQASINEGGEKQDAATQNILGDIMDDGKSGDKAKKIQAIRDKLKESGVVK